MRGCGMRWVAVRSGSNPNKILGFMRLRDDKIVPGNIIKFNHNLGLAQALIKEMSETMGGTSFLEPAIDAEGLDLDFWRGAPAFVECLMHTPTVHKLIGHA